MHDPRQQSQNEKWKALHAAATAHLDQLVEQALSESPLTAADLVRSQMLLIDLLEMLVEREDPG